MSRFFADNEFFALETIASAKERAEASRQAGRSSAPATVVQAALELLFSSCSILRLNKVIVPLEVLHTNVKELLWTFHSRKSGHFVPRFCGLFIPLLTDQVVLVLALLYRSTWRGEIFWILPLW
jgi:hypothetical protein